MFGEGVAGKDQGGVEAVGVGADDVGAEGVAYEQDVALADFREVLAGAG